MYRSPLRRFLLLLLLPHPSPFPLQLVETEANKEEGEEEEEREGWERAEEVVDEEEDEEVMREHQNLKMPCNKDKEGVAAGGHAVIEEGGEGKTEGGVEDNKVEVHQPQHQHLLLR